MTEEGTTYDAIVIGAGLYGLYSAILLGRKGREVLVLEGDAEPFSRATYINQARVHMGYHYPRSLATAEKSAGYFERFVADFSDCILFSFDQIYATSREFSWTSADQFQRFCQWAGIPCEPVEPSRWFRDGMVDGAFRTREYTYDAMLLKAKLLGELEHLPNVALRCGRRVTAIAKAERGGRSHGA